MKAAIYYLVGEGLKRIAVNEAAAFGGVGVHVQISEQHEEEDDERAKKARETVRQ